jgi:putative membrane protein
MQTIFQTIQSSISINKYQFSVGLIFAMHLFGAIIIRGNLIENFILLTPVNLIVSLILLLWTHGEISKKFIFICLISFTTGFTFEFIGTKTGLIFGDYAYGETLGFQIGDVPLIIGVNWLILVYSSAAIVNYFLEKSHVVLKSIISATLMVGLDFFIEPVAMKYDFWSWANDIIPIQNYIAWFIIAFFLLVITHHSVIIKNKIAIALFIAQSLFFIILNFV